jgi:hypothetical protein
MISSAVLHFICYLCGHARFAKPLPVAPKEVPLGNKGESLRSTRGGLGRGMGTYDLNC